MESPDESDYVSSSIFSDESSSFLPPNCNFQWIYTEATTEKNGVRTETSYRFIRDLKQNNLPTPSFNQSVTSSLSSYSVDSIDETFPTMDELATPLNVTKFQTASGFTDHKYEKRLFSNEYQKMPKTTEIPKTSSMKPNKKPIKLKPMKFPQQSFINPQHSFVSPQQRFVHPQQPFVNPHQTFVKNCPQHFPPPPDYFRQFCGCPCHRRNNRSRY